MKSLTNYLNLIMSKSAFFYSYFSFIDKDILRIVPNTNYNSNVITNTHNENIGNII
jgi:hypothetical protein